jgi:hypothetical protein
LEDLEGVVSSSEAGSLDVGFWKGIDRKRVDSILAVGMRDKMWRWSCLRRGW